MQYRYNRQRRSNILDSRTLGRLTAVGNTTIKEAAQLFIEDCDIRNLSRHTLGWYRAKLRVFFEFYCKFESVPVDKATVDEITPQHIKKFILDYRKGRASTSVNGVLRAVRAFLNFCHNEGISKSDGSHIKMVKEKRKVIETFSDSQIRKLLGTPDLKTFCGFRDFAIMLVLLDTGVRLSELVRITVNNVDYRERLIKVEGKGYKQRYVPMSLDTMKRLQKYHQIRGDLETDSLFVTIANEPLSGRQVHQRISDHGEKAKIKGVRCSPHTFRHSFAKRFLENGGDAFALMKLLGHTDITMTKRYVNYFRADIQKAHEKSSPVKNLFNS